jgi:hypothetical protein
MINEKSNYNYSILFDVVLPASYSTEITFPKSAPTAFSFGWIKKTAALTNTTNVAVASSSSWSL